MMPSQGSSDELGLPDLTWREIGGIPTLSPRTQVVGGPIQGCLVFGVGRSDETLPTSGITHLVEHLVLRGLGRREYIYNGQVGPVSTRFIASGTWTHLAEFLGQVVTNLTNVPLDGFDQERQVLEVEAQKYSAGQLGLDLSLRFGAQGCGLLGWPEHGLGRISPDDVRDWSQNLFRAANAAIWLSAPPPGSLDIPALPPGEVTSGRTGRPNQIGGWAWVPTNTTMVSASVLSRQSWGVLPALSIARDRAMDDLRHQAGVTYSVSFEHVRLSGGTSLELLSADAAHEAGASVVEGLRSVLADIAGSGPTQSELDHWQQQRRQFGLAPQALNGLLDSAAERRALGLSDQTLAEVEQRSSALTVGEVRDELAGVMDSSLFIGPQTIGDEVPGLAKVSQWSSKSVNGVHYRPVVGREEGTLVIGEDGISWILDDARVRTVPWGETAGVTAWDNGSRIVIGLDGLSVRVNPWNWRAGGALTSLVDDHTDPTRLITLGTGSIDYRLREDDPTSLARLDWIATIFGGRIGTERVDLILLTDGLLLLHRHGVVNRSDRLSLLRATARADLMAADPRSVWWPLDALRAVRLDKPRLPHFGKGKTLALLRIEPSFRSKLIMDLTDISQVEAAKKEFPRVLGNKFATDL